MATSNGTGAFGFNDPWVSGGNHGTGGDGTGGAANFGPRSGPPQAQNAKVRLIAVDTVYVSWTDLPPTQHDDFRGFWSVTYASQDTVGTSAGVPAWSAYVLNLSRRVATVESSFSGGTISTSFYLPGATDGYIQITGYYSNGAVGTPTLPILLNLSGSLNQIPDNVQSASITVAKERTPYDVLRLDATYTPPADTTKDYAGCHIHMVGYNTVAYPANYPAELGSMDLWDHTAGTQNVSYRLPVEAGQGTGTATLTNGSGAVVRVSGTNFAVGWIGRKFIVDSSTTTSVVSQVSAFADASHMTITPVWAGISGTYTWVTLNNVTFYFVAVGTSGARRPDYTAAVSASI